MNTEAQVEETLRLMKKLAELKDPVLKKAYLDSIRESHKEVIASFAKEVDEAIGSGEITKEEGEKILEDDGWLID